MKKYQLILSLFFLSHTLYCQDVFYGISNGAYLYSNPAFTGTSGELRLNNIYKNQFSILAGNYNTNFLSADIYKDGQGIGCYFLADQAGTASVRRLEFAGTYSYLSQITNKIGLSFGIGAGGGQSKLNFSSAIFEDQLQNDFSISETSIENVSNVSKGYFEVNSGILIYSERFWIGISGHHLNKPKIYSIQNTSRLNRKFGIEGGYVYNLSNRKMVNHNVENKNQLIYSLSSVWQGSLWRTSVGSKLFYNNIIGNVNVSNLVLKDVSLKGILVGAGLNYEAVTFIYGYEFYLGNELTAGGAHEIQVKIELLKDNKNKNNSFKNKKNIKTFCLMK